jgi:hypothetical protein
LGGPSRTGRCCRLRGMMSGNAPLLPDLPEIGRCATAVRPPQAQRTSFMVVTYQRRAIL